MTLHHPRRRWVYRLAALVVALVSCELALQGAVRVVPGLNLALMAPHERARASQAGIMVLDPVVGYRGDPHFPGHDALGFNNAFVPKQAEVVAIGDSLTYGVIGSPDLDNRLPINASHSWPAFVAERSGLSVYNMGLGGWGPVEYMHVLDEALAMKPRTIVLGFYLGNDLANSFRAVYLRKQYAELSDPALAGAAAQAEAKRSYFDPVTGVFPRNVRTEAADEGRSGSQSGYVRTFLSKRCKLFGFARAVKNLGVDRLGFGDTEDDWSRALRWVETRGDRFRAFDDGQFRTLLAPRFRHAAIDPSKPRNRAGLYIAFGALERCAQKCRQAGVDFVVAVLPTKELVFEPMVADLDQFPAYRGLVAGEHALRATIAQRLADSGIAHVDTLDVLRACFDRGEQPFAVSSDGHPNVIGYRAIAKAVAEHLRQTKLARLD